MRKLIRDAANSPTFLADFRPGVHNWDAVGTRKNEIQRCLQQMQGHRCAYCEGSLQILGAHIEHFRRRKHFPELTFAWTNLYWSCNQNDSCGHFKDQGAGNYEVEDLIDPCVDDPDHFFRFRTDGTISVRQGLSDVDRHRAEETLRVFNLNPIRGRLRNMRRVALAEYVSLVGDGSGFAPTELVCIFEGLLADTEKLPFCTAIRHVLTKA